MFEKGVQNIFVLRGLFSLAPDTFVLNPTSQLVIRVYSCQIVSVFRFRFRDNGNRYFRFQLKTTCSGSFTSWDGRLDVFFIGWGGGGLMVILIGSPLVPRGVILSGSCTNDRCTVSNFYQTKSTKYFI